MKTKIFIQEKKEKEIDIEFPFYRKQMLDNSTIYMKVESQEKQIAIQLDDQNSKVEVEIEKPSFWGQEDYLFGRGEFQCSEGQFNAALNLAKDIINNIV